jgi:hypothetical protein
MKLRINYELKTHFLNHRQDTGSSYSFITILNFLHPGNILEVKSIVDTSNQLDRENYV